MEPEKPFACTLPDCGMTFTNEDHLHVHTRKHDMVLQLGLEQKAAFVADQTPTPTRFIKNCEDVGLFQDLQNVNMQNDNPFDEGFKRAMETKHGLLSLENASATEDVLHTPHLIFPLESADCTLYTANNQRNITISRSSSDESGAVKEYETTTISKLTNEVTTISRVVGKDILDRVTTTDDVSIVRHEETARNKDGVNETSVSYTNNVIKILSNVEIRKDNINIDTKKTPIINTDCAKKGSINIDILLENNKEKVPPIMSQKSIDFVVDSLASDVLIHEDSIDKNIINIKRNIENGAKKNEELYITSKDKNATKSVEDYEVIIKLPNGKQVRMKAVDEHDKPLENNTKEKLKKVLKNKVQKPAQINQNIPNAVIQNIVPIPAGTFIPVTLMSSTLPVLPNIAPKVPIPTLASANRNFKAVKRKSRYDTDGNVINLKNVTKLNAKSSNGINQSGTEIWSIGNKNNLSPSLSEITKKQSTTDSESRSAASRRYRERLKQSMQRQNEENKHLRELNRRLVEEKALLQSVITQHLKKCPIGNELSRMLQEKLLQIKDNTDV